MLATFVIIGAASIRWLCLGVLRLAGARCLAGQDIESLTEAATVEEPDEFDDVTTLWQRRQFHFCLRVTTMAFHHSSLRWLEINT
jgi:hypothetical protein